MSAHSVGVRVGRALGWTGAQVVQRSKGAVEATGNFGKGVSAGCSQQYAATTASIAAARAAHYAKVAQEMAAKSQPAPVAAPAPSVIVVATN